MQSVLIEPTENVYTVSRLNQEARTLLEKHFLTLWVEGEISNFAAPQSGHLYFCLKDQAAQMRCAMFKMNARKLDFTPKDGAHVLVKGRVSLYENRGEFQFIVDRMEERGEGKLRRAFELLKQKLAAAGLFAAELKQTLPTFPKQIGVITSPTGAAIRDILTVLNRRFAAVPVIIYPTLVQGETAAPTIAKAIEIANQRAECDVLLLARGGGSLEDLWPFNEEVVAQAIFKSKLPIVSGVGHEVDFTIADYVADLRAPTPSAAAEILTPDAAALKNQLMRFMQQVARATKQKLSAKKQQLLWMQKHLLQQHPKRQLQEKMQRLDHCERALLQSQKHLLSRLQVELKHLSTQFYSQSPQAFIAKQKQVVTHKFGELVLRMQKILEKNKTRLAHSAATLDALSPLATLKRGYAIVSDGENAVLKDVRTVKVGDEVAIRLAKGMLRSAVTEVVKS